ncbi:hypothetical protein BGZ74_011640 [Mortierella antarctica]|nr:hypothetical protein BGZ74_011640 [Mortierella antarctica]
MEMPMVLIVGAGIGGLMLANLLQKGNIPFLIFERAKTSLTNSALYEEFNKIGKPNHKMEVYNGDLDPLFTLDFQARESITGSVEHIVARPDLYDLLLRQIPEEKILMNKKVLSFMQNNDGVMIRCSDNQTHHGDILVGADGAYSAVRQYLYKDLKAKKMLPKSDDVPLPFNCVCLVGQTEVLDPEEFPGMKLERSHFQSILGSDEYSFLNSDTLKTHDSFRNSEWGPEAAQAMCKEVHHFKLPIGKDGAVVTIGDLIDRTPKDLISKVMLEEKVFDTWYDRRTVLLGDVPTNNALFSMSQVESGCGCGCIVRDSGRCDACQLDLYTPN